MNSIDKKPETERARRIRQGLEELAAEKKTRVPQVRYVGGAVIITHPKARWPRLTEKERVHAALD
jgi:hypothetical protein